MTILCFMSAAKPKSRSAPKLPSPFPRSGSLRVVTYNVHFGKDTEALAWVIEQNLLRPDILLLQEMQHHPCEGQTRADRLAARLGYRAIYTPALHKHARYSHGLAILSRHPVLDFEVIALPHHRVLGLMEPRIALRAGVQVASRRLDVYNVHLDPVMSRSQRLAQVRPVLEHARTRGGPVVVGGDFNTVTGQASAMDRAFVAEGFVAARSGAGRTHRILPCRLDALYARGGDVIGRAVHRGAKASDHLPVELTLEWRPEPAWPTAM